MVLVFRYYAKVVLISSTVGHDLIPLEMGNGPSADDVANTKYDCKKHPLHNLTFHQTSQIISLLSSTFDFISSRA